MTTDTIYSSTLKGTQICASSCKHINIFYKEYQDTGLPGGITFLNLTQKNLFTLN